MPMIVASESSVLRIVSNPNFSLIIIFASFSIRFYSGVNRPFLRMVYMNKRFWSLENLKEPLYDLWYHLDTTRQECVENCGFSHILLPKGYQVGYNLGYVRYWLLPACRQAGHKYSKVHDVLN